MIISDERFAAARVAASGEAKKFDDIGCLVEHEAGELRTDVTYWVRNYREPEWLDARVAVFVSAPSLASPMGHDLAAVATEALANELAASNKGTILRLNEVFDAVADHKHAVMPVRPKSK
jgi:hypothetical protein